MANRERNNMSLEGKTKTIQELLNEQSWLGVIAKAQVVIANSTLEEFKVIFEFNPNTDAEMREELRDDVMGIIACSCIASMVRNGMNLEEIFTQIKHEITTNIIDYKDTLAGPE